MDELKAKYNELLDRYNKATAYMDCYHLKGKELEDAVAEREEHIPLFRELIQEMDGLLEQIPHTEQEVWKGFKITQKEESYV